MLERSDACRRAVTAPTRRVRVRIPLRIGSPDAAFGAVAATSQAAMSRTDQIFDGITEPGPAYATLEQNRWVLDGSAAILTDAMDAPGQAGLVSSAVSREDGTFAQAQTVRAALSGASILQALTLVFPGGNDGVPDTGTVTVYQGGQTRYQTSFSGNAEANMVLTGFTVYQPDAVALTVTRWSLPHRRLRLLELYPGYAGEWSGDRITDLELKMQTDPAALRLPYGSCALTFHNADRLFDPRNGAGLFRSLEERQSVPVYLGVDLPDGSCEYLPCGVWYQRDRAWTADDAEGTLRWDLVDIVGLLSDRAFTAPDTLPDTLSGWCACLVSQLGSAFSGRYAVDPDYAGAALTCQPSDLAGRTCGDVLRWICQATGVFPRADARNGYLTLEPLWASGGAMELSDLETRPALEAYEDIATLRFKLPDGDSLIAGNGPSGSDATVENPFLSTESDAVAAAGRILAARGGSLLTATGRGDPAMELGDMVTVQLDGSTAVAARLISQTLRYSSGMLRSCQARLLQTTAAAGYDHRVVLTESGSWTAPAGVTALSLILVGGGQAGAMGQEGTYYGNLGSLHAGWNYGLRGEAGADGAGGAVWYGTVHINEGQTFAVTIGAGGVPDDSGGPVNGAPTTFGAYSSAGGRTYAPSFTDGDAGSVYGRSGVSAPLAGSGDGGAGGRGGGAGSVYLEPGEGSSLIFQTYRDGSAPGPGTPGGSGCVIVRWNGGEAL